MMGLNYESLFVQLFAVVCLIIDELVEEYVHYSITPSLRSAIYKPFYDII